MWREHKSASACLSLFIGLPDLKKVVVIPYARSKQETDLSKIPNRCVCGSFYSCRGKTENQFGWIVFLTLLCVFPQCIFRWFLGLRVRWRWPVTTAGVRAASIQPSSVHHVLIWNHRGSQMYGPLCRGKKHQGETDHCCLSHTCTQADDGHICSQSSPGPARIYKLIFSAHIKTGGDVLWKTRLMFEASGRRRKAVLHRKSIVCYHAASVNMWWNGRHSAVKLAAESTSLYKGQWEYCNSSAWTPTLLCCMPRLWWHTGGGHLDVITLGRNSRIFVW